MRLVRATVWTLPRGAFALVEGMELGLVLAGAEGGLEEGGAQEDAAAFAHFGLAGPLSPLLEARIVAHEGLEAGGGLAPGTTGEDLKGGQLKT